MNKKTTKVTEAKEAKLGIPFVFLASAKITRITETAIGCEENGETIEGNTLELDQSYEKSQQISSNQETPEINIDRKAVK